MGYNRKTNNAKKKDKGGIKPGTPVRLYDGSAGVVVDSDRSSTTIKEMKYIKEFTSTVTMPTSQAKQLVVKHEANA